MTSPPLTDFPKPSYDEWRAEAETQLQGVPFEKKLVTQTYEGIAVQPIYNDADIEDVPYLASLPGFAPYLRGNHAAGQPWAICQALPYSDAHQFNQALRHDLARGQTAISMRLAAPNQADAPAGLVIERLADFATALAEIDLEATPIFINPGPSAEATFAMLRALLQERQLSPERLRGGLEIDPLGWLAEQGSYPTSLDGAYTVMGRLIEWATKNAPQFSMLTVHGQPYSNGGGHAVQELAFVMATAIAYLRAMIERGLAVEQVAPRMRVALTTGSNYFMSIAKLRAARLVWAKIVKAFGGDEAAQAMTLHAVSSRWNKTVYDPHVNLLRATTEAFSAAVGGCDSLHVDSFDAPIRPADGFSRRIARNTQLILQAEANLPNVIDPAGGSWYVESLTDGLARQAWSLLQAVERQGGMAQALQTGFPQAQVAETARQRQHDLATRKAVLIGSNKYANLSEKPLPPSKSEDVGDAPQPSKTVAAVDDSHKRAALAALKQAEPHDHFDRMVEAVQAGATMNELLDLLPEPSPVSIEPIKPQRAAAPFEALRAAAEAHQAQTGHRPTVFLAALGPIPQHKARVDFATDFFHVGGFEVVYEGGFDTVDGAAQAAQASGSPVVVICSTDARYPDLVPPLTQALKSAQPSLTVLVAGYPKAHVEAFRQAGVDEFIHVKANLQQFCLRWGLGIGSWELGVGG